MCFALQSGVKYDCKFLWSISCNLQQLWCLEYDRKLPQDLHEVYSSLTSMDWMIFLEAKLDRFITVLPLKNVLYTMIAAIIISAIGSYKLKNFKKDSVIIKKMF